MKLRIALIVTIMVGFAGVPAGVLAVLPPPKVSPLSGPGKAVADARVKLEAAKAQVQVIRRKIEIVFEGKPEWKAAKEAVDRAKSDYDAEGRRISADLEKNAPYKALMTRRDKDQAIIESATKTSASSANDDTAKVTPEDLDAATKDRLAAVVEMKAMEKAVEDADPGYAAQKQKYIDARAALDAMETQVDAALKLDPAYDPAQKGIDAAEVVYKAALASYASAAKAQHDADVGKSKTQQRR